MDNLTEQLRKTKKLDIVFLEKTDPASVPEPLLKLTGEIKEFKAGSRAKRYLVGFGAGKTKVLAHVTFSDAKTGKVLFADDVDGKVIIGAFGGNSAGAAKGLAKEVVKVARKQFFK